MFKPSKLLLSRDRRTKAVAAVIMAASAAVVGLMSVAVARDDTGVGQFFREEADRANSLRGSILAVAQATPLPEKPQARRVLTVAVSVRHPASRVAARKSPSKTRLALAIPRGPQPALFVSDPRRPAVVSIYDDRTLRRGDAVMTLTGLRVFAGSRTFPFRPEDFTTLTASRNIKGQLRRALFELDQAPLRG